MKYIDSIEKIEDNYQYFIFDIWGVIHDGDSLYPNVIETLKRLKAKGKFIAFLSNAPRRSSKAKDVLNKFGINNSLIGEVITSGELVYRYLQSNQERLFDSYGKKFYYIGPSRDKDLLDGLDYINVDNPSQANFAIVTGFGDNETSIDDRIEEIKKVKSCQLKMICANPDQIVIKKSGLTLPCAGQIAQYYQDIGGEVEYFGKPYKKTYDQLISILNITNKKEIVVIGDGLETDISGAYNNKIDSIFVTSGIISSKLGNKYNELPNKNLLQNEIENHKSYPSFIIKNL